MFVFFKRLIKKITSPPCYRVILWTRRLSTQYHLYHPRVAHSFFTSRFVDNFCVLIVSPYSLDAGATSLPYELLSKPYTSPVTTPPEATAAAALDVPRYRSRSRSSSSPGAATAGVGTFQLDMVRGMINEALEEFRETIRRDVLNLHMDVLKQFHVQQVRAATTGHFCYNLDYLCRNTTQRASILAKPCFSPGI